MSRAVTFTQAQVRRAVNAVTSLGLCVRGVTFNRDGSFTVDTGDNGAKTVDTKKKALAASWDDA